MNTKPAYLTTEPTRIDIRPDGTSASDVTFSDVLDAVNPLNYIPVVSDLIGGTAPSAGKIAMGALLGGPLGLIAGIASAVFESATGTTPVGAVVAALTGTNQPATQLARADQVNEDTAEEFASAEKSVPVESVEQVAQAAMPMQLAALSPQASAISRIKVDMAADASLAAKEKAVLDLYGNSNDSAHQSYRKAQMLPYLRDVTTSRML